MVEVTHEQVCALQGTALGLLVVPTEKENKTRWLPQIIHTNKSRGNTILNVENKTFKNC